MRKTFFKSFKPENIADPIPRFAVTPAQKERVALMKNREKIVIGIPRLLNQYSNNPLFSAYFESLGIPARNLVYSDYTNEEMYKRGAAASSAWSCSSWVSCASSWPCCSLMASMRSGIRLAYWTER